MGIPDGRPDNSRARLVPASVRMNPDVRVRRRQPGNCLRGRHGHWHLNAFYESAKACDVKNEDTDCGERHRRADPVMVSRVTARTRQRVSTSGPAPCDCSFRRRL